MSTATPFFGNKVLAATFVLAVFGWGVGFYGPPIFLHAVVQRTGWSVGFVSWAVTLHFVLGAFVVANLPRAYRRWGVAATTFAGALATAVGVYGWAVADKPAQLLLAVAVSGAGWVALGAAAVNALIAPWFVVKRPAALGMAYNGASVGGIVMSPLWVGLIAQFGFAWAAALVGIVMTIAMALLARFVFRYTPEQRGQQADGVALAAAGAAATGAATVKRAPFIRASADRRFITLAAGMALGLFAQIGLIAHLFSILVPQVGERAAGWAMALATLCAVGGRYAVGKLLAPGVDRRLVAVTAYAIQIVGSIVLMTGGGHPALLWLGIVLFGFGIGNATSLPPLIAQAEFERADVARVVPLIVAISQGTYAFAPAVFGMLRSLQAAAVSPYLVFVVAAAVQVTAAALFYAGRARQPTIAAA